MVGGGKRHHRREQRRPHDAEARVGEREEGGGMRREKNKWRRGMGGGMIGVISVELESYPIIALLFLLLYRTQGLHLDRSLQRMKIMAIIVNKKK